MDGFKLIIKGVLKLYLGINELMLISIQNYTHLLYQPTKESIFNNNIKSFVIVHEASPMIAKKKPKQTLFNYI